MIQSMYLMSVCAGMDLLFVGLVYSRPLHFILCLAILKTKANIDVGYNVGNVCTR